MSYDQILFEVSENVATITLNRPDRLNAFTPTMFAELRDALNKVEAEDNLRLSIVTGAGRCFCAGMDMALGASTFDQTQLAETAAPTQDTGLITIAMEFYFGLKKPVIVAINGAAVGVGVTMILPFDIRIAAESARLALAFNRRGVLPELASPWLLPRMIGISKAAELMYTGRMLSAQESLEYGLVSKVVPDDQLMSAARELADEIIVNCAPVSTSLTKQMLWQFLLETDVHKAEAINNRYFAWSGMQPDAREGVVSFLEKRPPEWSMKVPADLPEFFPLQ
jgi:enoyl-CoA hydratase/carnithine racemase